MKTLFPTRDVEHPQNLFGDNPLAGHARAEARIVKPSPAYAAQPVQHLVRLPWNVPLDPFHENRSDRQGKPDDITSAAWCAASSLSKSRSRLTREFLVTMLTGFRNSARAAKHHRVSCNFCSMGWQQSVAPLIASFWSFRVRSPTEARPVSLALWRGGVIVQKTLLWISRICAKRAAPAAVNSNAAMSSSCCP